MHMARVRKVYAHGQGVNGCAEVYCVQDLQSDRRAVPLRQSFGKAAGPGLLCGCGSRNQCAGLAACSTGTLHVMYGLVCGKFVKCGEFVCKHAYAAM